MVCPCRCLRIGKWDAAQFAFHQGEQFVQAAFLGIALISGLFTEALDPLQGVRFALTRDIPFPQTPSGIKNNGLAGFRADHWPVTPLGGGRWLKFSDKCADRIRLALDARTASVR